MADIVDILRNVTEGDAYAQPWTFKQHCLDAANETATLRQQLEEARERNLLANNRADNAEADAAKATDVLSGLSSYLGAGIGGENTSADDFDKRIRWGIDNHVSGVFRMCAGTIERLSQHPNTSWGTIKAELLKLADESAPSFAAVRALSAPQGRED